MRRARSPFWAGARLGYAQGCAIGGLLGMPVALIVGSWPAFTLVAVVFVVGVLAWRDLGWARRPDPSMWRPSPVHCSTDRRSHDT